MKKVLINLFRYLHILISFGHKLRKESTLFFVNLVKLTSKFRDGVLCINQSAAPRGHSNHDYSSKKSGSLSSLVCLLRNSPAGYPMSLLTKSLFMLPFSIWNITGTPRVSIISRLATHLAGVTPNWKNFSYVENTKYPIGLLLPGQTPSLAGNCFMWVVVLQYSTSEHGGLILAIKRMKVISTKAFSMPFILTKASSKNFLGRLVIG